MATTRAGGLKAAATNKAKDPDYYKKIGSKGGKLSRPEKRPFSQNRELARIAGSKGGRTGGRGRRAKLSTNDNS